jgi:hypothetical protein
MGPIIRPSVRSAPIGGDGERRRRPVAALAAALCLAGAAALAGCTTDEPALTLAFEGLPAGTTDLQVTLHAANVMFAAADASSGDVAVAYIGGDVQIAIKAAFAARHAGRIRLPLTAGEDIERLEGIAVATGGVARATAQTWTPIAARQSATLTFDFSPDGGAPDTSSDAGDGGAPDTSTDADASGTDADASGTDADAKVDAPIDVPADVPSPDVPADVSSADVPADVSSADMAPADVPVDTPPADVPPADTTVAPDATPDGPIPTTCTAMPPRAASSTTAGGAPTLAATPAELFGLAWRGSSGDILFNAFTNAGGMQHAADVTVVTAGTSTLGDPRLARIGAGELVLAYGERTTAGSAYAAAIKVNAQTGARTAGVTYGAGFPDATPPFVGGVAVNPSQSFVGIVSRRPSTSARTQAEFVLMRSDLTGSGSTQPPSLSATWTTALTWATSSAKPNRFVIAAVSDNSATGGNLLDVAELNSALGANAPFTRAGEAPLAGGGGATVSAAGLGDAVAVVWVDDHTGVQEVWLSVVDLTSGSRRGAIQVSSGGTLPRQYPKVVHDGAALAVAWLEIQNGNDSRIWLRRFDPTSPTLAPVGTVLPIGSMGVPTFGDISLAAAGTGKYGIAFSRTGSPGTKLFSYVECR